MAKAKSRFVCRDCGAVYPKWQGQCHECGAWNTLEEEAAPVAAPRAGKGGEWPRAQVGKGGEEGVGHSLYVMNVGRRMRI